MEKGLSGSIDILLQQGLLGVVALALAFVAWRIFKLYVDQRDKNDEIQEKRILEGRESVKAIEQNTAAFEKLTEVIQARKN